MAKQTQKKVDLNTFLNDVFASAQKMGTATSECVALLKSGNISFAEKDKERLDMIARAFKLGRISQILGIDKINAGLVQDKIKYDPSAKGGNSDKRRTMQEHLAYNAARSAWSHVSMLAGRPNVKNGKPRASKANQTKPDEVQEVDVTQAVNDLPNVRKVQIEADVQAFALRIASVMLAFQNRNASMVGKTAWFGLFEEFETKAKALALASAK